MQSETTARYDIGEVLANAMTTLVFLTRRVKEQGKAIEQLQKEIATRGENKKTV